MSFRSSPALESTVQIRQEGSCSGRLCVVSRDTLSFADELKLVFLKSCIMVEGDDVIMEISSIAPPAACKAVRNAQLLA